MISHRDVGVVTWTSLPVVLFATVKGASDMSPKSFLLRLLHTCFVLNSPIVHTHLLPIAGEDIAVPTGEEIAVFRPTWVG